MKLGILIFNKKLKIFVTHIYLRSAVHCCLVFFKIEYYADQGKY